MATLGSGIRKRFYQQAGSQLANDLPLPKVLSNFEGRLVRQRRKKAAETIATVARQVDNGRSLSDALNAHVSPLEQSLLADGERSSDLPRAMRIILNVHEMLDRMKRRLAASFFAPIVYLISLYVVLAFIGLALVPQFAAVVPTSRWTGWASVLYWMTALATGWIGPTLIALFAAAIAWSVWAMPRFTRPARIFLDRHIFPFTLYLDVQGYAWALAFSGMLRNRSDIAAIQTQIESASPWLKSRLEPILSGLENGFELAAAMRRTGLNFPSPDLIEEFTAYAGVKDYSDKLDVALKDYAESFERKLIFQGIAISAVFGAVMYSAFLVLQAGASSISSIFAASIGQFH